MIEIVATTLVVAPLSALAGAWWVSRDRIVPADVDGLSEAYHESLMAHSRVTDALNTAQSRIERALDCVTDNSAHVGKRMAKILKGEA